MAIAHQPVMTQAPVPTRPSRPRIPRRLVAAAPPSRAWTAARIVGLIAATALGTALAIAVVAGTALFALMNFAG